MQKLLFPLVVLAMFAVACGDDGGGGSDAGAFCDFVTSIDAANDDESLDIFDPASAETAFKEMADLANQAADVAPSEVRDDVTLLSQGTNDLIDVLDEYDWDMFAVPPDDPRVASIGGPEYEAAGERVNAFCGITDE